MKLWDKGFSVNDKIERFTVGKDRELDLYLAKYDIEASKAQAEMLAAVNLISQEENSELQKALDELAEIESQGNLVIEDNFEDIHSKIEHFLIEKCGDAGKKIHTARSRNDQVLVALQLFHKDYLSKIAHKTLELVQVMLEKAEATKDQFLPGYTHFQAAMPSSFGLWFSAYAENLLSDLHFTEAAYKIADQNPLGSGAGFGTSFNIDRQKTTDLLQFGEIAVSAVGAQMLRGKTEKAAATAVAMLASTLSKLSYDLVMYNSQDMGFVKLPNEMTTGSSIMPHKKNPDVFELTRAQCNKLQGLPQEITLVVNNLPSGYHRDFQVLKEITMEPMMQFLDILDILIFALPQIEINSEAINQSKYDAIYTVENINQKIQAGETFRDAYKTVGLSVEDGSYVPLKDFKTQHIGSIHQLSLELIQDKVIRFKNDSSVCSLKN